MGSSWCNGEVMTQTPSGGIAATAACELAGVTYRQLDYWARRGWVSPSVDTGLGRAGRRLYHPGDVVRLAALGHFGQAGLDVGKLGPELADLDLPLSTDFLVVAEADGPVTICAAERLRAEVAQPRARVLFDTAALQERLGLTRSRWAKGAAKSA
jgi:DNA-binding transcriptional MerR regulator